MVTVGVDWSLWMKEMRLDHWRQLIRLCVRLPLHPAQVRSFREQHAKLAHALDSPPPSRLQEHRALVKGEVSGKHMHRIVKKQKP
jgi:hypothetical protein